ncbi:carbohydrate-binding family 9-like protein [Fodinibius sp.]|uniref:carbohydrate-binding family 9-like protein n=1 Tax=Fodinibius sp. TaxID=1872440 RepID=UPI0035699A1B
MILKTISLFALLTTMISQSLTGQSNESLQVKRTADFSIDGRGGASQWSAAQWIAIPRRNTKTDNTPLKTRMKILYSDTGLYFLFESEDQQLSATMDADFMKLWKEDVVEVFLWPDTNNPVYFEYEISPLNYELPLLISNEEGDLARWRPYMYEEDRKTRHKTTVKGGPKQSNATITQWTAEFFIPYKLLRPLHNISPSPGTEWRANFYRVDYDGEQSTTFSWQPVEKTFHDYENFGTLLFE